MHTIGLLGGMSWHSTVDYYRAVNERVTAALGGHHSAPLLLSSVDFADVRACQIDEDWDRAGALLATEARRLADAGATSLALCTNLMHKVAPSIEAAVSVPLIHIADAVAERAAALGVRRVGLLGTNWVMNEPFYRERLHEHGIEALVPDAPAREHIDRIIWEELTRGLLTETSRDRYRATIGELVADGAEAVVLACTEIQLLVRQEDANVPVIDSLAAHADAIAGALLDNAPTPLPLVRSGA